MGNALLARAAGHEVLGADTAVYPPMSTVLAVDHPENSIMVASCQL